MIKCKRGAKELIVRDLDNSGEEYTSYLISMLGLQPTVNTDQATNTANKEAKNGAEGTESPDRRNNCRIVIT